MIDLKKLHVRHNPGRIFIAAFFLVWGLGFLQGLTGSACRKGAIDPDRRIIHCNVSIFLGEWSLFSEPYKRSIIYAARGIVNSQLGKPEEARRDFRRSWLDAYVYRSPRETVSGPQSSRQDEILALVRKQGLKSQSRINFTDALDDLVREHPEIPVLSFNES